MIGLVLPVSVSGKMIYRDTCDNNIPWDKELAQDLKNSWNNWRRRLPRKIEVPCHTEKNSIHRPTCIWRCERRRHLHSRICSHTTESRHSARPQRVQVAFSEEKPNNSEVRIGVGSDGNKALR